MGYLTVIADFLEKRIGVSSNQLLKCVLLNTALELFSYIDAPTYSSPAYQYHDWNMEDFDHMYTTLHNTGPATKSPDVLAPSLPSDGVAAQDVVQQSPFNSSDKLEIPVSENISAQVQEVPDLEKLDQDMSEALQLVYPVDFLLEFPFYVQQITTTEDLYLLFATDLQVLPAITVLNCSTTGNDATIVNACGVQTDCLISDVRNVSSLQKDALFGSFSHEDEMEPKSVFWDSYDMHVSRSPLTQNENVSGGWEFQTQDVCNFEDALIMVEEMAPLEEHDLDDWLYAELYPTCTVTDETDLHCQVIAKHSEVTREEPVSSTPYLKKTRSRNLSLS